MSREILVDDYNKIINIAVKREIRSENEKNLRDFLLVLLLDYFKDDMIMWYNYNIKGLSYRDISNNFNVKKTSIGNKFLKINNLLKELSKDTKINEKEIHFFKKKKKISKQKSIIVIKFLQIIYPQAYKIYCDKKIYSQSLRYIQEKYNIKTKKTVYDNCDKINDFLKFKKNDYNKFFI